MTEQPERWAEHEDPVEAAGYTMIQNVVMRDPNLSMQAKYVYGLLKSYAWQDPNTFPGVKTLCAASGVSNHTLGKYLRELVDYGLIKIKRRGQGKTNLYTFRKLRAPEVKTGSQQDGDTSSHNEDTENEDDTRSLRSRDGDDAPPLRVARDIVQSFWDARKSNGTRMKRGNSFGYHISRAQEMLDEDEPTDAELEQLTDAYMRVYTLRGDRDADACSALEELRRQPQRDALINGERDESRRRKQESGDPYAYTPPANVARPYGEPEPEPERTQEDVEVEAEFQAALERLKKGEDA